MIPFNPSTLRCLLYISAIIFIPLCSKCQQISLTGLLDGSKNQIAVDSSVTVTDTLYYSSAFNTMLIKPYYVKNVITLRLNEQSSKYIKAPTTAIVNVVISYKTENGEIDSTNASLNLAYDPDSIYQARTSYIFHGAHMVTVRISSLTNADSLKPVLLLENEMIPYRQYTFDCAVSVPSPLTMVDTTADVLKVGWPNVFGTDEVDLEWTYLDTSAFKNYKRDNNTWDTARIFTNNATRVTVADYRYNIPLLFPDTGALFVRVRPVQYRGDRRITGRWSSEYLKKGMLMYNFKGHEPDFNWQSDVSFAEEGKKKAVVQYFDGSLRQRQTVTKDNTTNNTVVTETMYDYQGRPAIKVMPAPTLNTIIGYSRNFNVGLNNAEYEKSKYDLLSSSVAFCDQSAPPMDSTSGASYYYSSNIQSQLNAGINKFIPNAYNYPFTETEYTPDNTGRIKRQSGVGPTFKMGSHHETKYYYAITPDQNELDALFGTDAGDKTHYFKNAVQDANGQVSLSYVDMHGRTIATALSGDALADGASSSLVNLDSNIPATITETIADAASNVTKGTVMESHKSLLVTKSGTNTFHYSLNPQVLSLADCSAANICYECRYDLTITITDDCNNHNLPNDKPYTVQVRNFKLDSVASSCSPHNIDTTFNLFLNTGNYEITKTLSLSQAAEDRYRDSVFVQHNTCKSLADFIVQQRALLPQSNNCTVTCTSCLASIGTYDNFKTNYIQNVLGNQDSSLYIQTIHDAYDDAVASCNRYCSVATVAANSIRDNMLLDVTPSGGQYADPSSVDQYSIFAPIVGGNLYQSISGYKDENGKLDTIFNFNSSTYKLPQQLTQNDFIAQFKPSWASSLITLHPEYCKLTDYESQLNSYNWNTRAQAVTTYAQAATAGFTNPFTTPEKDPLTSDSRYYSRLYKAYNYYDTVTISGVNYPLSIWDFSKLMVNCPTGDRNCQYDFVVNNHRNLACAGDSNIAWQNFINLYIQTKLSLLNQHYDSLACSTPAVSNISSQNLLSAGHRLNFITFSAAIGGSGLDAYMNKDSATLVHIADSTRLAASAQVCNSYKTTWTQQLLPGYGGNASYIPQIEAQLVAVCIAGSDARHPLGSRDLSTQTPSVVDGSNSYRSFDDVITTFNASHSIQRDAWHNADILALPAPYYGSIGFNQPVISKPDSLQCDKINSYYNQYLVYRQSSSETFSQYLLRVANTQISDADLTDLMNSCTASGYCKNLSHPVTLPAIFQPNTAAPCIGCAQMNTLYQQYKTAYPSSVYDPKISNQSDTVQQRTNLLFTSYMNNHLGYSLTITDYLDFLNQCSQQSIAASQALSLPVTCNNWAKFIGYQPGIKIGDIDISGNKLTLEAWINRTTSYYQPPYYYPQGDIISKHEDGDSCNYLFRPNQANVTTSTGFHSINTPCLADTFKTYHVAMVYDGQYLKFYRNGFLLKQDTCTGNLITNSLITTIGCTAGPVSEYYNPSNFYGLINEVRIWNVARTQSQIRQYMSSSLPNPTTQTGLLAYYIFDSLNNKQGNAQYNGTTQYNATIKQTNPQCNLSTDSCGYNLSAMDGPMLCNKPVSSVPPPTINPVNNCTDSTFYIVSAATERFAFYKDSLKNVFDSLYHARCLTAFNYESFTVSHTVDEFHYTLYYYDQAGNLVQTVPPQAVKPNWNSTYLAQVKTKRAAGDTLRPGHNLLLATRYLYNSLNQVVSQKTPDAKTSAFFYDRLGRLVVSQNRKQNLVNKYSYTSYDGLGRITEVGELTSSAALSSTVSKAPAQLAAWLGNAANTRAQITQTVYDKKYGPFDSIPYPLQAPLMQRNLRNRVSFVKLFNAAADQPGNQATATYYSYDIHGNVDTLVQDYKAGNMQATNNQYKRMVYTYDLISGKVNSVAYQPNRTDTTQDFNNDAFYQRYTYDEENRLTNVETSTDSIYWENEAFYKYYRHGPLARMALGEQKVQGVDYAYTLQGWLKGVNSSKLASRFDMGIDGQPSVSPTNATIAQDVFGFALYYYGMNDYHTASTNVQPFADAGTALGTDFKPLYNGNIAAITETLTPFTKPLTYNYRYDQLNRLMQMRSYRNTYTGNGNVLTPVAVNDFSEDIAYDANGNIQKYKRYANSSNANLTNAAVMDSMSYYYNAGTNQLNSIKDQISATVFSSDIDNQPNNNYRYDSIGNLIKDSVEGISSIEWTVYGKISKVTKTNGTVITYTYDATGNRISKKVTGTGAGETWYVRDASGNVMSTYNMATSGGVTYATWSEADVYGSSRVATYNPKFNMLDGRPPLVNMPKIGDIAYYYNFNRGLKLFELTNHLGNVLATVTDTKIPVNNGNTISYYTANLINATEYAPFGMRMRGRDSVLQTYNTAYRYGFNGKEQDKSITSQDYDYGMRIYDARVGRFLSVDPITKKYPELTPYQFASNSPIAGVDLDGLEFYFAADGSYLGQSKTGGTQIRVATEYSSNPENKSQMIFTKYKDIDKVSSAIASKVYTTIFNREVKGYVNSINVIKEGEELSGRTTAYGNFEINIENKENGELLMKDYYNAANTLYHENQHSLGKKVGKESSDAFSHFNIVAMQVQTSSTYAKTSQAFKNYLKEITGGYISGMEGVYGLQSFISVDDNGNKFFKDKASEYSFNKYYKDYSNAVGTYNKMFNENRKVKSKDEFKAKFNPPTSGN